jgi:hypothetical protein
MEVMQMTFEVIDATNGPVDVYVTRERALERARRIAGVEREKDARAFVKEGAVAAFHHFRDKEATCPVWVIESAKEPTDE